MQIKWLVLTMALQRIQIKTSKMDWNPLGDCCESRLAQHMLSDLLVLCTKAAKLLLHSRVIR